jgi:hypothetical protein
MLVKRKIAGDESYSIAVLLNETLESWLRSGATRTLVIRELNDCHGSRGITHRELVGGRDGKDR